MTGGRRRAVVRLATLLYTAAMLAMTTSSAPAEPSAFPDSTLGRLEALALTEALNSELLSHDSATLTLERWCGGHRLASPPRVTAERQRVAAVEATEDQRRILGVAPAEPVRYRRVRLKCGDRILSEADNWYVPGRLDPDMVRQLDTTEASFGRVVASLGFARRTLSADLLWRPLPDGWEPAGLAADCGPAPPLDVPAQVLRHRAVLLLPGGTPFSLVVETYTGEVLRFGPR